MSNCVLILGSGNVSACFVRFLLERVEHHLVVADLSEERARAAALGNGRAEPMRFDASDASGLSRLIREIGASLVVSLLPPALDPLVARVCIDLRTPMLTTSYASRALKELDGDAQKADVLVLAEIGLDPGIDHLLAARAIDAAHGAGAEVIAFESVCGAIPAQESSLNPFAYKFSWFPRGALAAVKRPARFLRDGRVVTLPEAAILEHSTLRHFESLGWFEDYPNMDALPYAQAYGIPEARTLYRGTLRYPGWCETLRVIHRLGLLDEAELHVTAGRSYRGLLAQLLGMPEHGDLEGAVAERSGVHPTSTAMQRLVWLGIFAEEAIPLAQRATAFDILLDLMLRRLRYERGERDLVALDVSIVEKRRGQTAQASSQVVAFGTPEGDSATAQTVAAPAAIAAQLILEGRIALRGVRLPIDKSIYLPVLGSLPEAGIAVTQRGLSMP